MVHLFQHSSVLLAVKLITAVRHNIYTVKAYVNSVLYKYFNLHITKFDTAIAAIFKVWTTISVLWINPIGPLAAHQSAQLIKSTSNSLKFSGPKIDLQQPSMMGNH